MEDNIEKIREYAKYTFDEAEKVKQYAKRWRASKCDLVIVSAGTLSRWPFYFHIKLKWCECRVYFESGVCDASPHPVVPVYQSNLNVRVHSGEYLGCGSTVLGKFGVPVCRCYIVDSFFNWHFMFNCVIIDIIDIIL